MTTDVPAALRLFYSYAQQDEAWRQRLDTALSTLKRQGYIASWHKQEISAGTEWEQESSMHLNEAHIILLLVSPDFVASDSCYGNEMQRAMERHEAGEARVLPILVRPTDYKGTPFEKLRPLPKNAEPITRWRDPDEALLDVAQGIREVVEVVRPSLTPSPSQNTQGANQKPPALQLWTIPYRRNPFFTGREDLLKQLRDRLTNTKAAALTQPHAISGLGGIGKTQTAVEYAYRYHDAYPFVLWVSAATRETLLADFVALADQLHLPERREQDQNKVIAAVKSWFATHKDYLLILDNADDLALADAFLPVTPGGHVVLTTRASVGGSIAHLLTVERLNKEEGVQLLLRRTRILAADASLEQVSMQDRVEAEAIVNELGSLPLALDQAGAYLEETGCRLADYLGLYRTHRKELLQRRSTLPVGHPEPVATTWALSFQKVEQANPAAADLLRLCSFLAPDSIPEAILTEGADELGTVLSGAAADAFALNAAIEAAQRYSLLRRQRETHTLTIHRLVQAVLIDDMPEETQQLWAERAVRAVRRVFPTVSYDTWAQCQRYLPQVQVCTSLIDHYHLVFTEAASLCHSAGYYLDDVGQYEQAESFYQQALHVYEKALPLDHSDTVTALHNLAVLYQNQGKYEQAEAFYQRALHIYEKVLPPEHPSTATTLYALAMLYRDQGKYEQAEALYQRALCIDEHVFGPDHAEVATDLEGYARLLRQMKRLEEAATLEARAKVIRAKQHP